MGPLDVIRQLAAQAKRLRPATMSDAQSSEFMRYGKEVYSPEHARAKNAELSWLKKMQEAKSNEQRAKFLQAAKEAEYRAARLSKLDQAAKSIGVAARNDDEGLRAFMLPREGDAPGGLATFYQPGHLAGDPFAGDAAALELLGSDMPGAGRVLLREVGLDSPTDPLVWNSTAYPETMNFYKARGATEVPRSKIPRDSLFFRGTMPVFHVPRGDMIKEAKGGLVRMKEARCGC